MRIDTITSRKGLKPRSEPYYVKLSTGCYLGYRKGKKGGSWVVRLNKDLQRKVGKLVVEFEEPRQEYDIAAKLAKEWFKQVLDHASPKYTLQDAIDDYTEYLQREKTAIVYKTAAAVLKGIPARMRKTPVHKITTKQLDRWRVSFVTQGNKEKVRRSQNTSNRRWSDLRACLNRAFQQGYVVDKTAWERIKPYKKVQKGRQIFWTKEEVSLILDAAADLNMDFHRLLKAGLLSGCRVGELRTMKVKDFDKINGSILVAGKTGHRDMFLSSEAIKFFKNCIKDKHPAAWLLDYKGRQWPEDYHHKLFRRVRKIAMIDLESTFYCARHWYISQGLKAGISPDIIAKNCGTSPAMIFQFYGKFTSGTQKEAVNIIGAVIGKL